MVLTTRVSPTADSPADSVRRRKCQPVVHLVVLYATDLAAVEDQVRGNGGEIVRETFAFPGGRRFHFTDPSGNELAVWSDR
jgi:predicted enzyme related to lactoylglutathione lyase